MLRFYSRDHVIFIDDHIRSMTSKRRAKTGRAVVGSNVSTPGGAMKSTLALTAALLLSAILIAPDIAAAAGEENPTPPASQNKSNKDTSKKAKKDKSSSAEDFLTGYHAAYALIYDKGDYEAGIAALRALGYDDNADVATLVGYASRKLGRYDDAKLWYERALAADPNHAVTWSYYGMWQAEQGNVLKAKEDLEKVRLICGTDCKAYNMLKDAIAGTITY
jgi:tetratricopeptide (TPR) repeat protein